MKKRALFLSILCLCGGSLYAGLSLGRPAAVKKRVSKLDDKVRAGQLSSVVVNRAPAVSLVSFSDTVVVDGTISLTVTATDPDADTLSYAWTPATTTIIGAGAAVNWVAPSTPGVYGVTCTVSDGQGHFVPKTAQIAVVFPGNARWVFDAGNGPTDYIPSSPAIGPDGTIYFGSTNKNLYAVNPGSGTM